MRRLVRLSEIPSSMTEAKFWEIIGTIEHELLELKESPSHLTAPMAAMAMTSGGIIVLGVSDSRSIVGCALSQRTFDRVTRDGQSCGIVIQPLEIDVAGRQITLVGVPEIPGHIVTTPDGRLLRRVGSDNQPLVGDALARFVREREQQSAEEEPVMRAGLAEIDLDLVNEALVGDGRPKLARRAGLMRALVDLGVAVVPEAPLDPQILKAAVVLFARNPTEHLPGASVQIVRRAGVGPGPGPTHVRTEIVGPIARALDQTIAFIEEHSRRSEAVVGRHREAFPEYPPAVLREAILNALAHRSYALDGATIDVTVWDDRIEVRSPGPLPGHITLDNMREEHFSRNRRVMKVLRLMSLVEEYGEGVDRMYREMETRLMEPPRFSATAASVTVTLHNRSLLALDDQVWLSLLGHVDLSPPERRALVLARNEGSVTPRRLRQALGDSVDVDALIGGAIARGLLVMVGRRGGARYTLTDEMVMRAGEGGVEARSRKRQMLLDEIHRRGSLSTNEAAEHLNEEDRQVVKQLLDDLVTRREVEAHGRTRARRYYPAGAPPRAEPGGS